MHTTTLTVHVYDAPEFRGDGSDIHLWDFGAFTCLGTDEAPTFHLNNIDIVHAVLSDPPLDADWKQQQDGDEREVTVYEHDYGMFCETVTNTIEHVAFDDTVWRLDSRLDHPDKDDEIIALKTSDYRSETKTMHWSALQDHLDKGEAVPLLELP